MTTAARPSHVFIKMIPESDAIEAGEYAWEYIDPDPMFHCRFRMKFNYAMGATWNRTAGVVAKFSKRMRGYRIRMLATWSLIRPLIAEGIGLTPIGLGKPLNDHLAQVPHG